MKRNVAAKDGDDVFVCKTNTSYGRAWTAAFASLGLIPFAYIVSLLTFYYRAAQILGYAPSYDLPDPGTLPIYRHYSPVINLTAETWLYALVAWIMLTVIYLIVKRRKASLRLLVGSGIGHCLATLLFLSGIMEWYFD